MKIKSQGFSITTNNPSVNIDTVFNDLIQSSHEVFNRSDFSRQVLVSSDGDFYTGLVLTYKNQKTNFKSTINDGRFSVKAEDLQGDEKLVTFNFFCLRKNNLKGLYLYHHGSCSLSSLFSHLQTKTNKTIRLMEREEIKALGDKPDNASVESIRNKFKERLSFSIILDNKQIETVLSGLKKINTASFKFSHIDFQQGSMTAVEPFANTTDIIFNIDSADRHRTSPIANRLKAVTTSVGNLVKAKVIGIDHSDNERIIDFFNCPAFFDEYDFDTFASHADGLTNENYIQNQIAAIIKEQIIDGANRNAFN